MRSPGAPSLVPVKVTSVPATPSSWLSAAGVEIVLVVTAARAAAGRARAASTTAIGRRWRRLVRSGMAPR
jgi:hypothetical protein